MILYRKLREQEQWCVTTLFRLIDLQNVVDNYVLTLTFNATKEQIDSKKQEIYDVISGWWKEVKCFASFTDAETQTKALVDEYFAGFTTQAAPEPTPPPTPEPTPPVATPEPETPTEGFALTQSTWEEYALEGMRETRARFHEALTMLEAKMRKGEIVSDQYWGFLDLQPAISDRVLAWHQEQIGQTYLSVETFRLKRTRLIRDLISKALDAVFGVRTDTSIKAPVLI